jgi:hypothetical protein
LIKASGPKFDTHHDIPQISSTQVSGLLDAIPGAHSSGTAKAFSR